MTFWLSTGCGGCIRPAFHLAEHPPPRRKRAVLLYTLLQRLVARGGIRGVAFMGRRLCSSSTRSAVESDRVGRGAQELSSGSFAASPRFSVYWDWREERTRAKILLGPIRSLA